ncbi:MAG: hypothetical protein KAG53_01895 [Endozoicomonadaceae bacterium]|nr:hypothetical protein [Endozoicomonadaceae bacterium]
MFNYSLTESQKLQPNTTDTVIANQKQENNFRNTSQEANTYTPQTLNFDNPSSSSDNVRPLNSYSIQTEPMINYIDDPSIQPTRIYHLSTQPTYIDTYIDNCSDDILPVFLYDIPMHVPPDPRITIEPLNETVKHWLCRLYKIIIFETFVKKTLSACLHCVRVVKNTFILCMKWTLNIMIEIMKEKPGHLCLPKNISFKKILTYACLMTVVTVFYFQCAKKDTQKDDIQKDDIQKDS